MYENKNEKKQLDGKFELMHCVWNSNLTAKQKNILNYLLALADKNGECYPNTDTLCKVASIKNQRKFDAIEKQLPGIVSAKRVGRKNFYKVDLAAVRSLPEMEVVTKTTPSTYTPPNGTDTPPNGDNTPPNGGLNTPPNGGANTTVNTTKNTTTNTTVSASADAATLDQDKDVSDKDNDNNPALRAAPDSSYPSGITLDSPIVLNESSPIDVKVDASPIALNTQGGGGGTTPGRVTDKWKKANGVKVIEMTEDPFAEVSNKPAKPPVPMCSECNKDEVFFEGKCFNCG